jgi:hypothetical protein
VSDFCIVLDHICSVFSTPVQFVDGYDYGGVAMNHSKRLDTDHVLKRSSSCAGGPHEIHWYDFKDISF